MNKNTPKSKNQTMDYKMLAIVFSMLLLGLIILYSASTVLSFSKFHTNTHFFFNQLVQGVLLGLVLMYICSKIDYHFWQKYAPLFMFASIALLMAVLVPGIGLKVGNSRRWIAHGGFSFQPAELAKLSLIFYISSWIDKRSHEIKDFYYGIIPSLIIISLVAGLIILEPDIGTMLVVIATSFTLLFVGGSRIKHLGWILVGGFLTLVVLVKLQPYRLARFTTFLNPGADPQGIGYQINQALVAVGSAGFWGQGYGNSRQKYNFLPEVMGDSIFAVTVEELGFLRSGLIVGLYILFAFRGLKIADHAPDAFGKMLASGIIAWIVFQALINIGAIIGLLPLTGIPLPFISYGSSSLVVTLAAMGILLNVSKQAKF
ncbi:MAG: Cell division protein FtsW [Candidatus Doudnabacteria bacterium]|nr:Cell division protein FtsW [Candidatus Doudnabacteria bacterium]